MHVICERFSGGLLESAKSYAYDDMYYEVKTLHPSPYYYRIVAR